MWYSETGLFQPKKKKATPKKTPAKKTPKEKENSGEGVCQEDASREETPKKRKKTEVDAGSSSEDDEPLVKKSKAKKPPSVSCLSPWLSELLMFRASSLLTNTLILCCYISNIGLKLKLLDFRHSSLATRHCARPDTAILLFPVFFFQLPTRHHDSFTSFLHLPCHRITTSRPWYGSCWMVPIWKS